MTELMDDHQKAEPKDAEQDGHVSVIVTTGLPARHECREPPPGPGPGQAAPGGTQLLTGREPLVTA